jgi:diguanylate cyclase (GGDEF)-like protein
MAAEGGYVFGALVLEFAPGQDAIGSDRRYPLALALAEQTALALSNLRLREALQQQSIRDGLTGVFNRRHLDASLARELNHCQAHGRPLALAMIDIDHFKPINDRYGHAAGDQAIRVVAEAIQASFRSGDEVCRYGGEEFVVLLADTTEDIALQRAEALRATLRDLRISHDGVMIGTVSVSIGVAVHPRHGDSVDALLGAADVALYAAKEGGRDRVVLAGR